MITSTLLNMLYYLIELMVLPLPRALKFPDEFHSAFSGLHTGMHAWDQILPVHEVFVLLSFLTGVGVVYLSAKLIMMIVAIIRGMPNPIK